MPRKPDDLLRAGVGRVPGHSVQAHAGAQAVPYFAGPPPWRRLPIGQQVGDPAHDRSPMQSLSALLALAFSRPCHQAQHSYWIETGTLQKASCFPADRTSGADMMRTPMPS